MKLLFTLLVSLLSFGSSADQPEKMILAPTIYNGTKSVEGEFLPMGWIGNCTGTAVGPQTIVTAAHCVRTGTVITYTPRFNGQSYRLTCTRHPRYNDRTVYNDYAICKLNSGSFPADMPLASFLPENPQVGEKMLLNGYGAPNVRVHHWGPEAMDRINGQDIVACGRVVLGGGDSGGSLLKWTDDRSGKSGFQVIGINSRAGGGCSYFNRISHQEFSDWARQYEASQATKLCGISLKCTGSAPPPPPPPSPSPSPVPPANCWKTYEEFAFCIGTKGLAQCLARADVLKACVL